MRRLILSVILCLFLAVGQKETTPKTIQQFTKSMTLFKGLFNYYHDSASGKIYLEIKQFNSEFLYVNSLPAGIGSNDIGLDRGQLGGERVVRFERFGPKVLLIQPNLDYRADSSNPMEKRSVEEAFAKSAIWGFSVVAESKSTVLVELTDFIIQDSHHIKDRLQNMNQGNFSLDKSRSALYMERTKNFPKNSEFEAIITFTGTAKGRHIRSVTPNSSAITVRVHHSFIELPDANYQRRKYDPRSAVYGLSYQDYATPIEQPLIKRFAMRHRLKKKNPNAAVSEAVEPIIYYLDPGAPEPVKSALLEGARWWNQAFEAIGYKDAFQVKVLPEDADPLDVRYNVIQWVHRSTRGWSYGGSVSDPRTGEIIKGHVSLGSLRVRQDFLIAEGLLAPHENGTEADPRMLEMALARLRQLSAHEVGHTIGITHNFAASTNNRASVMDYPHPLVKITDGKIDLSDAYAVGIGDWDKVSVAYGYSDFANGTDENKALDEIINNSLKKGLKFIADNDARPSGGLHPDAHLWDNGLSPTAELNRMMQVRKMALRNYSENVIPLGQPMSNLENALVPMYLFHRFQVEAVAKLVGGMHYTYKLRGDAQTTNEIVSADTQIEAIEALLMTLNSSELMLPEKILNLIPPKAYGYSRDREQFNIRTNKSIDPISIAETAADMTLRMLLNPDRALRMIEFHSRDSANPGLTGLINQLLHNTWFADIDDSYQCQIQKAVNRQVLKHLLMLASNKRTSDAVREIVSFEISTLKQKLTKMQNDESDQQIKAHYYYAIQLIKAVEANPDKFEQSNSLDLPPGSPIGMSGFDYCEFN